MIQSMEVLFWNAWYTVKDWVTNLISQPSSDETEYDTVTGNGVVIHDESGQYLADFDPEN